MLIKCPYCDIDVDLDAIEAEDGCCPECGAIVSVTTLFGDDQFDEEDDELDDDLDYDDLDEEFEEEEIEEKY